MTDYRRGCIAMALLGALAIAGVAPRADAAKKRTKRAATTTKKAVTTTSTVPVTTTTLPPPFVQNFTAEGALASLQSTGRNVSVNVVTLNATAMISVSMNTASLVEPEGRTSRVRVGSPTSLTDMVVSSGAFTLNGGTQTGITCRESGGIEAPYGFELLTSGATWILNQLSAGVRTPLASGPLPAAPAKGPQELVPSDGFEKAALKFTAAQFIPLELSCRGAAGSPGQIVGKAFGKVVVTLPVGAMPGPGGAGFVLFSDRSAGSSTSKGVFGPITITAI